MAKRKISGLSQNPGKNKEKKNLFYVAGSIVLFVAAWTIIPRLLQYSTGILYKLTNKHNQGCNKKPVQFTKKNINNQK